jgi:hypothetical protein
MKTTIEQSRHLAELGVDLKTADLTYERIAIGGNGYTEFPEEFQYRLREMHFQFFSGRGLPCWSLEALLELMPEEIVDNHNITLYKACGRWVCCYQDLNGNAWPGAQESCDIVLAAYRMVVWLVENGYIKTEKP